MKRFIAGFFAAALLATTPAFAGGGHGHHGDKHFWKEQKHREKEWRKFEKHREKEWRKAQKHAWKHERRHVVVQHVEPVIVERHVHYVEPRPVYYAPAPVHVPAHAAVNIQIPLR